jgi:hypothetical protein
MRVRISLEAAATVHDVKPSAGYQDYAKRLTTFHSQSIIGKAQYQEGAYADAEKTLRSAAATRATWPVDNDDDKRDLAETVTVYLAMALARQHRLPEAQATIAPVVAMHRELAARNHGDNTPPIEASCLRRRTGCSIRSRRRCGRCAASRCSRDGLGRSWGGRGAAEATRTGSPPGISIFPGRFGPPTQRQNDHEPFSFRTKR